VCVWDGGGCVADEFTGSYVVITCSNSMS